MTNPETGYASVNGIERYYEVHGEGDPLVLLHGGVGASEMFGENLPELAKSRQVIAVHLQAHGHTADIDRPMSYEAMADDIAALISHLDFGRADVMGWSLGGGVALQTAIRHPEVVVRIGVQGADSHSLLKAQHSRRDIPGRGEFLTFLNQSGRADFTAATGASRTNGHQQQA